VSLIFRALDAKPRKSTAFVHTRPGLWMTPIDARVPAFIIKANNSYPVRYELYVWEKNEPWWGCAFQCHGDETPALEFYWDRYDCP
jgi:hypothetical protein